MNWKLDFDYWDPYKQQRQAKKNSQGIKSPNKEIRVNSNEKRIGRLIVISSSKQKKKVLQRKSTSKDRKITDQKPFINNIYNEESVKKKEQNTRNPPSYPSYSNKRIEIVSQPTASKVRKSPIKIIKKSPSKIISPPPQNVINTIVEAPSSIASSILNNFESHPSKLLNNLSDQKFDRIFNF